MTHSSRRRAPALPAPATPTTDASGSPLCPACLSPDHPLRGCSTQRAVDLLLEQDQVMSADAVRARIGKVSP